MRLVEVTITSLSVAVSCAIAAGLAMVAATAVPASACRIARFSGLRFSFVIDAPSSNFVDTRSPDAAAGNPLEL